MRLTLSARRPTPAIIVAGLLGGAATASGIALTATSGWLIVRASEQPVMLTLLTAIVAVRTFGIARPFFRYIERLKSHDIALGDLLGNAPSCMPGSSHSPRLASGVGPGRRCCPGSSTT